MTCITRWGILAVVGGCFLLGTAESQGQPGVTEKVTCENYFETPAPKGATIKMYRYGKWEVNTKKWAATRVVTERVEPDGKGGWKTVMATSREYALPAGDIPLAKGTYGLTPGDPVPMGFVVDNLPNVSGAKTYWRATLYGVDTTKVGAKDQELVKSAVQELVIP